MATKPGERMIPLYIKEPIYREIKVYAAQTDQSMQEVMKPLTEEFEQSAIKLAAQIKEMKRQADIQQTKEEEEARIAAENPMNVSGLEVNSITKMILEPAIS